MENTRFRGRKRYCCYYCNIYFYQVDSWQRHNRKHTGVEIECDDCGEMCSDSFELKAHQQLCEAYRVYSEELCTEIPNEEIPRGGGINRQNSVSSKTNGKEETHETPDSTSKQESIHENEGISDLPEKKTHDQQHSPHARKLSIPDGSTDDIGDDVENDRESMKNSELDDMIGEDKDESRSAESQEEPEDPETEAMIGVDQSEVSHMKPVDADISKHPLDENIGVDSQIVIKVESALNEAKQNQKQEKDDNSGMESGVFLNRPSPAGSTVDSLQTISMENSEMSKKYQPYFCKNCGARFTRKDSVTRHLKKGTCSGKSAIVCNICGKVFSEMFELQEHFKVDHKKILLTPAVVSHRSILPKPEQRDPQQSRFPHYPNSHYVVHDQHIVPVSRGYPDQSYRAMPPGIQNMFYVGGSQDSYVHRPATYPQPAGHYREQPTYGSRPYELKYSPVSKDMNYENPNKMIITRDRAYKHGRKREYEEHSREQFYEIKREESHFARKRGKGEMEYSDRLLISPSAVPFTPSKHRHSHQSSNINLSEYTNNAMNNRQYYDKRFIQKETIPSSNGKDESPRVHQCKVCGLEFPRFEYLLTHLRKHKEKPDHDRTDLAEEDTPKSVRSGNIESKESAVEPTLGRDHSNMGAFLNDSGSSDDSNDNRRVSYVRTQPADQPNTVYSSPVDSATIVVQQPRSHFSAHPNNEGYIPVRTEQVPMYPGQQGISHKQQPGVTNEGPIEAITPGVDGKFRPFICENCGQRFTRKDSLVRHAKKQTCFEEATELKCKHCDKTFRYHKCLVQHQELVHGIAKEEQHASMTARSEEEDSDSDKSEKVDFEQGKRQPSENEIDCQNETKYRNEQNQKPPVHQTNPDLPLPHTTLSYPTLVSHQGQPHRNIPPFQPHHVPTREPSYQEHPPHNHPATKFVPPKMDEKFKIQPPDGAGSSQNTQDAQYIGYCTVPRPFQCEYCGDRFAHRHSLKRHVRRHLGIGIPCHECGKLYRDQSEWRRHQRSIHNRHYEKYEVPSRISFRDSVEHGLIGVLPSSEYSVDNDDGSESEKSEDEQPSMMKNSSGFEQPARSESIPIVAPVEPASSSCDVPFTNRHSNIGINNNSVKPNYTSSALPVSTTEEKSSLTETSEEKLKAFNFKSYSAGDKDSRKSVLDLYLRSPQSDEEDAEKNNNGTETRI